MSDDYSGRKGRDGRKKKIGKVNEKRKREKVKKDEKVNGQGSKKAGMEYPRGVLALENRGDRQTEIRKKP